MKVSSPDKVMFPDAGIVKADVVGHYERVGEHMLRFISGRPLTLQRFPAGIGGKGFMQKNAAEHFPATIGRYPVPKRDGGDTVYPVVDRAADLAYLANQNTITFHMWTSSIEHPDHPDWLVLDLDPEPGGVDDVRTATRIVGAVLGRFGLTGFVLATGSKGFHVWVRLDGASDFDDVGLAARALAGLATLEDPDRLTTEFLKKNRKGRVFVDWLRATPSATVVAPFSLRPRAGAPVAVPLTWDELDSADPAGWTLDDLGDRFDVVTDLAPSALPVDDIVAAARDAGVDLDTPHDRFGRTR